MSLIGTLKRLLDPEQQKIEEAARRVERELPKRDAAGDAPLFECRICKKRSAEGAYCVDCLSETMVPVKADPR